MAYKHVRPNTAQGLVAVQMDFGLSYVTHERAQMLVLLYGAKIVGATRASEPAHTCAHVERPRTGRRVIIKKVA